MALDHRTIYLELSHELATYIATIMTADLARADVSDVWEERRAVALFLLDAARDIQPRSPQQTADAA